MSQPIRLRVDVYGAFKGVQVSLTHEANGYTYQYQLSEKLSQKITDILLKKRGSIYRARRACRYFQKDASFADPKIQQALEQSFWTDTLNKIQKIFKEKWSVETAIRIDQKNHAYEKHPVRVMKQKLRKVPRKLIKEWMEISNERARIQFLMQTKGVKEGVPRLKALLLKKQHLCDQLKKKAGGKAGKPLNLKQQKKLSWNEYRLYLAVRTELRAHEQIHKMAQQLEPLKEQLDKFPDGEIKEGYQQAIQAIKHKLIEGAANVTHHKENHKGMFQWRRQGLRKTAQLAYILKHDLHGELKTLRAEFDHIQGKEWFLNEIRDIEHQLLEVAKGVSGTKEDSKTISAGIKHLQDRKNRLVANLLVANQSNNAKKTHYLLLPLHPEHHYQSLSLTLSADSAPLPESTASFDSNRSSQYLGMRLENPYQQGDINLS